MRVVGAPVHSSTRHEAIDESQGRFCCRADRQGRVGRGGASYCRVFCWVAAKAAPSSAAVTPLDARKYSSPPPTPPSVDEQACAIFGRSWSVSLLRISSERCIDAIDR